MLDRVSAISSSCNALAAASDVIRNRETVVLSPTDWDAFFEALVDPRGQIEASGASHSSAVDLRHMLKEHSEALFGWLKELVDELQRREKEQRVAIVTRGSVSALMHPSWRWLLSKIHEASLGAADKALLAQHSVPCLREIRAVDCCLLRLLVLRFGMVQAAGGGGER